MPSQSEVTPEELEAALIHNKISARRWHCTDIDEIVSAGNEGIVDAMQRYDRSKGLFISYAALWIAKRQRVAVKRICSPLSIPHNHQGHFERAPFDCANDLPAPEPYQEDSDAFKGLYDALARLPDGDRERITKRYFDRTLTTGRPSVVVLRNLRLILTGKKPLPRAQAVPLEKWIEEMKEILRARPGLTAKELKPLRKWSLAIVYRTLRDPQFRREGRRHYLNAH